jgi:hypothetical protein
LNAFSITNCQPIILFSLDCSDPLIVSLFLLFDCSDSLSLLIDFCAFESHEASALLVLRNLCFHAANKPKMLANGNFNNKKVIIPMLRAACFESNESRKLFQLLLSINNDALKD